MKFALLGEAPAARPVVQALAASEGHEVVVAFRASRLAEVVAGSSPGLRLSDDPTEILAAGSIDAAVVSGFDEAVLDAAKRLAADGTPLLFVPDGRQDLAYLYELTLVRDDVGTPLVPFLPSSRGHRLDTLQRATRDHGRSGDWWRIDRETPEPRLTKADADAALLEDVLLLQSLGGSFEQVTALRTGESPDGFSATTVTLGGPSGPEVSWTLRSGDRDSWALTIGEAGPVADVGAAEVTDADLELVVESLRGGTSEELAWGPLVRAFEIVDATRRSLRRRRTIDLLFETTSERNQFKSQMAAGGCALLMYLLFASVLIALTGSLPGDDSVWKQVVPWLLLLPVAGFLALQLLYYVARPSGED